MNILLVCSTGASTGMMVQKMQAAAKNRGIDAKIWAVSEGHLAANIGEADAVLLGPQIRYLLEKVKPLAGNKPVGVIDMRDYGTMDGEKVLAMAQSLLP